MKFEYCLVAALVSIVMLSFSVLPKVQAERQPPVFEFSLRDDIKAGTVVDVRRAVQQAEEAQASHLIIKLDTPGGLLQSTRTIVELMQQSSVQIVVFVDQPGGWAFSAGTIMLLAADVAVVHPNASIGAAQPFTPGEDTSSVQDEKVQEATVSWVRSLAQEHGRDRDVAARFVTENLTLRGQEALEAGVIDATAVDQLDVLQYLSLEDARVETIEPTLIGRVLNVLSDPFLVSLFLSLGSLGILLAIRSGEFEISGAVGVVLLLIGLWGIGIIEFTFLGAGLLVLGAILIMIELFDQPGFGIFGVAGFLSLIAGALTLSEEPFYQQRILSVTGIITVITLVLGIVIAAVISRLLVRSIKRPPTTGKEHLIGQTAVVTVALRPRGRVKLEQQSWQAKTTGAHVPKGTKTCIIDVQGNTLFVEPVSKKKGS